MQPIRRVYPLMAMAIALLIAHAGCAKHPYASKWRGFHIVADGDDAEWQQAPQYYNKEKRVTIRFANDSQALYLCLATDNPALQRQMAMHGVTIWLDPQGGEAQRFGVRLPDLQIEGRPDTARGNEPPSGEAPSGQKERSRAFPAPRSQPPGVMEVTPIDGTGPVPVTLAEARRAGLEVGAALIQGRSVYELKVGFKADPALEELKAGCILGVGLLGDTPDSLERGGGPGKPPGFATDPFGGSRGGSPPGAGGPPGGGPNGGPPGKKGESLKVWLRLQLAGDAQTPAR